MIFSTKASSQVTLQSCARPSSIYLLLQQWPWVLCSSWINSAMSFSCRSTFSTSLRNTKRKCNPSTRERRDQVRREVKVNLKVVEMKIRTYIRIFRRQRKKARERGLRHYRLRWLRAESTSNSRLETLTRLRRSVEWLWWLMRIVKSCCHVRWLVGERNSRWDQLTEDQSIHLNTCKCLRIAIIKNTKGLRDPFIHRAFTTRLC